MVRFLCHESAFPLLPLGTLSYSTTIVPFLYCVVYIQRYLLLTAIVPLVFNMVYALIVHFLFNVVYALKVPFIYTEVYTRWYHLSHHDRALSVQYGV